MNDINKRGYFMNVPREVLDETHEWQWPRKHHTITHPITPERQARYDAYKQRWADDLARWQATIEDGEKEGWARDLSGYDYEPAELLELQPEVEYIYDETIEEWRARVDANFEHHDKTGQWLEEPQPSFIRSSLMELAKAFETSFRGHDE